MPYIKKIELKSFKSFGPKRVNVTLGRGLTVFSGPNGSGKTNIVDAILFGLGELSARRLRAESSAKLIFHGAPNAGIAKSKAAKVVIQFDNFDNRIPVDTSTVTVSREVRRNGQSIYRLNGRRISRSHISEILSMAGISSTGHNIIVQGTITRIAEISSTERRKIIEDLVGIAQYDAEKAEAQEKLRAAEISIQTAMGRIDEVQQRVDDLERERNDLLRHTFIHNEIKRFEAMKVSHEILETETRIEDLSLKMKGFHGEVEKLRQLREDLRFKRNEVTTEWRSLSSEVVEEGETKILEAQIKIGDFKSSLTELTTKIGVGKSSLEALKKVRENNFRRIHTIKEEITDNRKETRKLKRRQNGLQKEMAIKQSQLGAISNETTQLWDNMGENAKKIRETEQRLDECYQSLIAFQNTRMQSRTNLRVHSRRLRDLNARHERLKSTLNELEKTLIDLQKVQKEQNARKTNLQKTLDQKTLQNTNIMKEVAEAGKIAKSAREAVVEFVTQLELAEAVGGEERALRNIEELGNLGVIQGVYGRLGNLIKITKGYKKAIDAAASGWLNSLVVRDFDSAFTCTETLKRLKLGRIKIVPLKELSNIESLRVPNMEGVAGTTSAFIRYAKRYEPAVRFVFGDTLISEDDKSALISSRNGYRAVTVNGDLYEAGGGIESGYYRAPIDFTSVIPNENAVKTLDQAVQTLQGQLLSRKSEITVFEEEINRNRVALVKLSEFTISIENGIKRVQNNIKRSKRNIKRVEKYTQVTQRLHDKEKTKVGILKAQRRALDIKIKRLRKVLVVLRLKIDPSLAQEKEIQRVKLEDEIADLRQTLGDVKTELSTIRSKSENVLKTGFKNFKIQLRKVEQQISTVEEELPQAIQQKKRLEDELLKVENSKEELSSSVLTARQETKKFTLQIDDIDKRLDSLDTEYERASRLLNQLQLDLQTSRLQLDQHYYRLKELGYEEALKVSPEYLEAVKTTLKLMRFELERLGAINQLALTRYTEQISRYKEISIRMNELEQEKRSILSFIDEVERKKREVFMNSFNRINENLNRYFSKLTGGGEATLKILKPEEPFAGGIDLIVRFPNKPPIIVSGASGGERSVAAVAFILTIQDFMPASFYLLDEVDAHLDAFHVAKLGELLIEESAQSQFLVVTLKAELVSKAEKIYGVYERNGVSNVVSVKFGGSPNGTFAD